MNPTSAILIVGWRVSALSEEQALGLKGHGQIRGCGEKSPRISLWAAAASACSRRRTNRQPIISWAIGISTLIHRKDERRPPAPNHTYEMTTRRSRPAKRPIRLVAPKADVDAAPRRISQAQRTAVQVSQAHESAANSVEPARSRATPCRRIVQYGRGLMQSLRACVVAQSARRVPGTRARAASGHKARRQSRMRDQVTHACKTCKTRRSLAGRRCSLSRRSDNVKLSASDDRLIFWKASRQSRKKFVQRRRVTPGGARRRVAELRRKELIHTERLLTCRGGSPADAATLCVAKATHLPVMPGASCPQSSAMPPTRLLQSPSRSDAPGRCQGLLSRLPVGPGSVVPPCV